MTAKRTEERQNSRNEKTKITNVFVRSLYEIINPKISIYISISNFELFGDSGGFVTSVVERPEQLQKNKEYDFIVGDLPIGMGSVEWESAEFNIKKKIKKNWSYLIKALLCLSHDGLAIFNVEPAFLTTNQGKGFEELLEVCGFYFQGHLNTPEGVHLPQTSLQDTIVLIKRKQSEKLFIGELFSIENANKLAENYSSGNGTESLLTGIFVPQDKFRSFHNFKFFKQMEALETQYKDYESYKLEQLAKEINAVKTGQQHEEKENSIYIPCIGNSDVISNLREATIKHQNYYQVVLDKNYVLAEYLQQFFISELGRMVLKSQLSGSIIPRIRKIDLNEAEVAVPPLQEQKMITTTVAKLKKLKFTIDGFSKELALNPANSTVIQEQLENLLNSLGMLSDADKIRAIIRQGETRKIEFKQTLSMDVKTLKKEKHLEKSALKTVAAFLNTEGGSLLIGVADEGKIIGIKSELDKFFKSQDKYLRHFRNLLKDKIGQEFYTFVEHNLVEIDKKKVLLVECKPANRPCFLKDEFYVRTNPATDKLEGPKVVEYIQSHFKN